MNQKKYLMAEFNSCLYAPALEELIALEAAIAAKCRSCSDPGSVEELLAVGAASGANCRPCLEYHAQQALELAVSREDVQMAVSTALAAEGREIA
jgi:AhpD family alkylhydroperoxidase